MSADLKSVLLRCVFGANVGLTVVTAILAVFYFTPSQPPAVFQVPILDAMTAISANSYSVATPVLATVVLFSRSHLTRRAVRLTWGLLALWLLVMTGVLFIHT